MRHNHAMRARRRRANDGSISVHHPDNDVVTAISPPPPRLAEPPLVAGWPSRMWQEALVIGAVAAVSLTAGFAALALQRHYSDAAAQGEQLGRFSQLLADG